MTLEETRVNEILRTVKASDPASIQAAAHQLLSESTSISGDVAIFDDHAGPAPYVGLKGKAKGPSNKGSGYTDVELPNGTVIPVMTSLLIKL